MNEMDYTISLSEVEVKALKTDVLDIQEYIDNFIHERCRRAIDKIVAQEVERKITNGETISGTKGDIVLAADVITVEMKNAAMAEWSETATVKEDGAV